MCKLDIYVAAYCILLYVYFLLSQIQPYRIRLNACACCIICDDVLCVCVYPDPDRVGTSNNRPPAITDDSVIRNSFNVVSAGRQSSTHLKYESQFKQNGPAKTFIGDGQSTCNAMLHLQYGPYRMVPRQNFQRSWHMCP